MQGQRAESASVAETRTLIEGSSRTGGEKHARAEATLDRLARAGRFHDEETAEHVERMSRASALIARVLGWEIEACMDLRAASAMHDIGKVAVPDAVLRKPGPLTPEERALIEQHPQVGHEILTGSGDPVIELAATVALTHHERVDGNGYPRGLRGDDIPLPGRIVAVADVYDALTHDRVYRPAFSSDDAVGILRKETGAGFDPPVVDAFESALLEIAEVQRLYTDTPQPDEAVLSRPIRVLVVSDDASLARELEPVLRDEGLELVGAARDVDRARAMLQREGLDVAVIDTDLGGRSGLDLVKLGKEHRVRCLIHADLVDNESVAGARLAGAEGVVARTGSARELSAAMKAVAAGETYFDQRFHLARGTLRVPSLTPREREVVVLLATGLTGEEIAARLFLSPETVRTHIRNAMNRAGARTRAHLVALAVGGALTGEPGLR